MAKKSSPFTRYQVFVIAIIAFVQFTVILDFMVLSPLGAQLMRVLRVTPVEFGTVVSAYAFSAGASGLLAAGFADKFDRKRLLLIFYTGFIVGTLCCGLAPTYTFLLLARIVTGVFAGVLAATSIAIITDLFALEVRGQVMGYVQMAFAVSQILGIPFSLYLANLYGWHAPFLMIVGVGTCAGIVIALRMRPVNEHLFEQPDRHPLHHFLTTLTNRNYMRAFGATALLTTGGFLLMPFSSAFAVKNVGITEAQLPLVFMVTGVVSMIGGPMVGKLSDKLGKFRMFTIGSILSAIMIVVYTNLGVTPLGLVMLINSILLLGITSRMIAAGALTSAVPEMTDRGAFMGVNSSLQQISGGIASIVGGMIIAESSSGTLLHFDTLGYIAVVSIIVCIGVMLGIDKYVTAKYAAKPEAVKGDYAPAEI